MHKLVCTGLRHSFSVLCVPALTCWIVGRDERLAAMVQTHRNLSQIFRDIDDKMESVERKAREEKVTLYVTAIYVVLHVSNEWAQGSKGTMVGALPPSVSKFEEKNLISLDNAANTTSVRTEKIHSVNSL